MLELAWNMGLLTWADSPKPGWYDTDGNLVPEEDIAERYHDEVVARSGIRPFEEGMGNDYKDGADEEEAEVFLDHDVTFSVPTRESPPNTSSWTRLTPPSPRMRNPVNGT